MCAHATRCVVCAVLGLGPSLSISRLWGVGGDLGPADSRLHFGNVCSRFYEDSWINSWIEEQEDYTDASQLYITFPGLAAARRFYDP